MATNNNGNGNGNGKQPINKASNHEIMNHVRANASQEYQNNVPVATAENATATGLALTTYTPSMNEFVNVLVNKIAMTIVSSKLARNKLAPFKAGTLPYGKDIEEVFVDLAAKATFDPVVAETEVFKRVLPNVKAIFHRENRRDFYKVTVSQDMLKKAFLNNTGLGEMVSSIVQSLYSADINDEYKLMKELMTEYGVAGNFTTVTSVKPVDTASAKKLAQDIKKTVTQMSFMSTAFNKQGVNTYSDPEDLVLFLIPEVSILFDTELLAFAFNSDKFDFKTQIVLLDNFGTNLPKTQAILVDKKWFQVYDTNFEAQSIFNPQNLSWNYFVHHWQTLSTSQFANAVKFDTV